ncbi:spore coat protein CotJB [Anoxybacillus sp. LAT_35]|uniref:spore coat protein CotJB n=1 Tax=Anoxybacillus TaxID=150247 RepID=UPI000B927B48|nr:MULTISPECIES: spore coat protein CotJB [Anoxybacillus]AST06951.1 spore coat protein CotJB [Anoxybacillus flavithermus]MCG6198478.1 spore coat protein CotJB [Anoxybacillus sp. LAT_38]NUJ41232.1 spore coat protein CotJB [Pseudoalteromonas sp. 0303]MCG3083471.1 spore coat protein CotJB [Anoxybacillus sp. LAT27]MCG5024462.1 spore coat protein CotJB [Anoxybacillus flavithermus]
MSRMPKEYYDLLHQLQAIDFALVDLTLYLDTHPNDYEAIRQFNELSLERRKLKKQYETQFGPLQQYGNSYSQYPWDWSKTPWPWQV